MEESYNVKVVSRYVYLNPRKRRNFIRIQIFLNCIVSSDYDTIWWYICLPPRPRLVQNLSIQLFKVGNLKVLYMGLTGAFNLERVICLCTCRNQFYVINKYNHIEKLFVYTFRHVFTYWFKGELLGLPKCAQNLSRHWQFQLMDSWREINNVWFEDVLW